MWRARESTTHRLQKGFNWAAPRSCLFSCLECSRGSWTLAPCGLKSGAYMAEESRVTLLQW
eukprot:4419024-Amphidinium_carterae.1